MDRTVLILTYLGRSYRGYTSIRKYTVPLPHLLSVVPITAIHPNGVIEFTGRSFGILLKADPPRVSDDDLTRYRPPGEQHQPAADPLRPLSP